MQTDEDVGKVAAAVPVIISRSLELFIESFIQKTATITKGRNAKTLSAAHIKQTIHSEKTFDFLRDLVVNVPDHQPDEEGDGNSSSVPSCSSSSAQEGKKPKVPRPRKEKTGNGRGRPRKKDVIVKEEKQEKEETESEDDDEEGSDSDSSQTNTDQFQASTDTSKTHPPIMQTPPQPGLQDPLSTATPTTQTNPTFDSPASLANIMPPSVPHHPLSPRLPQLQSPPQFSNMGMMPLPQLQSIPHPQFQNIPNQLLPPQQQYSGLTNQIPPPPSLTNFSNQLPVQPNFYPAHMSQSPQYPAVNSPETFHSDQKSSFMMSRETPPFSSPGSQFRPQLKQEEFNPGNSYRNNIQNNEPLDMSKSSQSQRSPVTNHKSDQGNKTGMPISFPGLSNIMNMAAAPKPVTDDEDYDT